MSGAPRSVVVTVGDELLLGRTVDTNSAWLGAALADLGAPVLERATVADTDDAIRDAVVRAMERAPLVVLTGGLGPTDDDRTRPAVAGLLGIDLVVDPDLLAALEAKYLRRGYDALPPANVSQALVPAVGKALPNPAGSAPGLVFEAPGGGLVILMPGPPRELRAVFPQAAEEIRRHFGDRLRPVRTRTIHTTGIAESVLAPRVEEALGEPGRREATVAYLPDLVGVDVRLTVRDVDGEDEAQRRLDRAEERLDDVVARYRFEAPGTGDLSEAVFEALGRRGLTLATAESCTGGLVAKRITDNPGSSRVFVGGVVTYSNAAKERLLGVPGESIASQGAVSREVAEAMAKGCRERLGADCAIAITGIAGPEGGSEDKPVGTVWWAVAVNDRLEARRDVFPGDREGVRARAAQASLHTLLWMLGDG